MEVPPELCGKLRSVLHYNGLPIDARSISDGVRDHEGVPRMVLAETGTGSA
jgi:hypothetical protein